MTRSVLGAAVLALLAACSPAAQPSTQATIQPPGPGPEVRASVLPVPAGMRVKTVEFADADHGYVGLWSDIPESTAGDPEHYRYASAVFATKDGGRAWIRLADPRPPSESPQMYTVDKDTVVLMEEPGRWHVSTDGGASFRLSLGEPAEMARIGRTGPYHFRCYDGCFAYADDERLQPDLPGSIGGVAGFRGDAWVSSVDAGAAYTAASSDRGRTWRRVTVPDPGIPLSRSTLHASADGADLWLVGFPRPPGGSLGSVVPMRRKDVGMPLLWQWADGQWTRRGTLDAPRPSTEYPYAVAAVGAGQMAVTGPHGLALVDAAWHPVELFPRPSFVTALRDGTIFAPEPENDVYYLGTRAGPDIRWVQLELTTA